MRKMRKIKRIEKIKAPRALTLGAFFLPDEGAGTIFSPSPATAGGSECVEIKEQNKCLK